MTIRSRLENALAPYPRKEFAVVINGEYLTYRSKLVYVSCKEFDGVITSMDFYIHVADRVTGKYVRESVGNAMNTITEKMLSNRLYSIQVNDGASAELCRIEVCTDSGLLVLESHLYTAVRKVIESGKEHVGFVFGSHAMSSSEMTALIAEFKRRSYKVYGDLIYSQISGKFINKLNKINKFYGIQKAFIPVFVDYAKVYNPFRDKNHIARRTTIYQLAESKNRVVQYGLLSCYMLTHREICEALGMTEFMRWTPDFFYKVFVGLLFPSYAEFPSKGSAGGRNEVFYRFDSKDQQYIKQSYLTLEEASKLLEKCKKTIDNPDATEEARRRAIGTVSEFNNFNRVDTLYLACAQSHRRLVSIGSSMLDEKSNTTLGKIYEYVEKATIKYGG